MIGSLVRMALAAVLGYVAYRELHAMADGAVDPTGIVLGLGSLFAGAVVIAPVVARLLAQPAGGVFSSTKRLRRAVPMYGVPESLVKKGEYQRALSAYERLARQYPDERRPHVAMIEIAIVQLRDAELAEALYRRGLAALQHAEDRDALSRIYEAMKTTLA